MKSKLEESEKREHDEGAALKTLQQTSYRREQEHLQQGAHEVNNLRSLS